MYSEAYLKNVQATYRYYCYHAHNSGTMTEGKLNWIPSPFHIFLCDTVQEFVEKPTNKSFEILIINTPPQHGKGFEYNTPVLTDRGWVKHGELKAGDYVYSPSGKKVKVLASQTPYYWHCKRLTLDSGDSFICSWEHEWLIESNRDKHEDRKNGERHEEILETQNIFNGYHAKSPAIRVTKPIEGDSELRVDNKTKKDREDKLLYFIKSVEDVPNALTNCITVEGGMYLVGKGLIPTHNSESVTATFPSWYLMRNPDNEVICVSYGDDLSRRFGKKNLDKIKKYGNIFGVKLDQNKHNASEFRISGRKGVMISAGYGSGITGNPAKLIVIDDPVKNRVEADSPKDREKKWADFVDSIESRTANGTKIILIMTRWHEDDLAGRLIENYGDRTTVVNLPCEAEEGDPLGRKIGDPLCPEIGKGKEWLKDFKKSHMTESGMRSWNALYQGHPSAREGNIIKREWWEYYTEEELEKATFDKIIMSVDAAFKDSEKNDFVAISVWGKRGEQYWLLDMQNKHLNFTATVKAIKVTRARYTGLSETLIEDTANGTLILQLMKDEIAGLIAVRPDVSKEARVNAISFLIEAGNVRLPKFKKFTWEFVEQCASFPNGKHDDMVDSMSQALNRLYFTRTMRRKIKAAQNKMAGWGINTIPKRSATGKGDTIHVI
jgi:predicted phage terminase large subunit-like protein